MRRLSLRARIAVTCAVAIVVALTGMAAAAFVVVDHELYRSLDLDLSRAALLAQRTGTPFDSDLCRFLAAPPCTQTVTATAKITKAGAGSLPVTAQTLAVATGKQAAFYSNGTLAGFPVRMYTSQGKPGVAIEVGLRTDRIADSLDRIGVALGVATAVGLAVATAVGIAAARTGLRPLMKLTATAERIAATADPDQHIDVRGSDEVARLAGSLNTMLGVLGGALDSLQRALVVQRRFVADASHELRTPLTALRTNVELLAKTDRPLTQANQDRVRASAQAQAGELTELVNDLLELARAEDPDRPAEEFNEISMDALVAECVERQARNRPEITWRTDLQPTSYVAVRHRMAKAITNLLDNAAKYSPPGGTVDVVLREGELTVRDQGPGIPDDVLPHVFDRFYRGPNARHQPGSGIGLAIVKQVAETQGAEVIIENAPEGGTTAKLILRGRTQAPPNSN